MNQPLTGEYGVLPVTMREMRGSTEEMTPQSKLEKIENMIKEAEKSGYKDNREKVLEEDPRFEELREMRKKEVNVWLNKEMLEPERNAAIKDIVEEKTNLEARIISDSNHPLAREVRRIDALMEYSHRLGRDLKEQ